MKPFFFAGAIFIIVSSAIDIFTPRGARAGSFMSKAPGAFDLSKAGLSNGVYQIRVRAGSDIFWFKAPVVR